LMQARHRYPGAGQGGRGVRWNEQVVGHRVLQDFSDRSSGAIVA
jgi:hypothetical protein